MTGSPKKRLPQLRRDKASPCEDFWHTIRIGAVIALVLFTILPRIM